MALVSFDRVLHLYFNNLYASLIYSYFLSKLDNKEFTKININTMKQELLLTDYIYRKGIKIVANYVKNVNDINININNFGDKAFYYYYEKTNNSTYLFFNIDNHNKIMEQALNSESVKSISGNVNKVSDKIINDNTIFIKIEKRLFHFTITDFIASNETLKNAFVNFLVNRNKKRITQDTITDYCLECQGISNGDVEKAIEICKRSAKYNWSDLYPLDKIKYSSGSNGNIRTKKWQTLNDLKKNKDTDIAKRLKEQYEQSIQDYLENEN